MGKVSYIIGDIHGCFQELLALEKLIREHSEQNNWTALCVCVGDLIDRGPESARVVEHFRQGCQAGTHAVVMGNHESEFLRQLYSLRPDLFATAGVTFPPWLFTLADDFTLGRRGGSLFASLAEFSEMMLHLWLDQGGRETILSYHGHGDVPGSWDISKDHLRFLVELPFFWQDDAVVVSHALAGSGELALLGGKGAEAMTHAVSAAELKEAVFTVLWSRVPPQTRADPSRWHISGHTPRDNVKVATDLAYMQIDTGCVYGKRLTAYCARKDEFLQVDSQTKWLR